MYRIAVLAEQEAERQRYAEQITRFCEAKGLFPQVMQYDDQERFFETAQKDAPTFRLRADYFLMKPVSEEAFQRGLNAWIE